MSATVPASAPSGQTSRWILLVSLALNLFFVGVCGAIAWRHYLPGASPDRSTAGLTAAARIDRLAAALPSDDSAKLRAEFRAREAAVEGASSAYRGTQERMRGALRAEPFDIDAVRAAMLQTRAARQKLDELLQDVIASASAQMSSEGRRKLANWTPARGR